MELKELLEESEYQKRIDELFVDGRQRVYQKNQLINYHGDALTHVYQIVKGHVKAYTILESGDTRTILILSPGDIFPIAFSVSMDWSKYHIKYFYQTMTEVKLKAVDRDNFVNRMESDMKKMQSYLAYLSATNQAVMNQLEVMKNKKAINKIELLLPYLILKLGDKVGPNRYKLRIKLSHQEVADLSGVTRETTTALVKQLEKAGMLKQQDGFWIIRTDKLEEGPFDED